MKGRKALSLSFQLSSFNIYILIVDSFCPWVGRGFHKWWIETLPSPIKKNIHTLKSAAIRDFGRGLRPTLVYAYLGRLHGLPKYSTMQADLVVSWWLGRSSTKLWTRCWRLVGYNRHFGYEINMRKLLSCLRLVVPPCQRNNNVSHGGSSQIGHKKTHCPGIVRTLFWPSGNPSSQHKSRICWKLVDVPSDS